MSVAEAFEIVLELARDNMIGTTHDEYKRQAEAIAIIEDIAVNEYGDD